ncbi:MAG: DUF72 domain-containing protein [Nitrospirota bacterium]
MPTLSIPENVRLGTSSWAYAGWKGQVYRKAYSKSRFAKDCLAEYAAYEYGGTRLFRTVGVDHSFYRPPTAAQWADYAAQVPEDFRICSKVWEDITVAAFADHPRYGTKAGKANPHFLDAALCEELVLAPARAGLSSRAGPLIFEFQRFGLDPESFVSALDRFLSKLPAGLQYAVEVRNPAILGARYHSVLNTHGVAHVYNHWTSMPALAAQHAAFGHRFSAPFALMRLLTPLGTTHADAVKRYAPYSKLVQPQPRMRTDVLALIRQALAEQTAVYVLANNRAEGNAPSTIQAIADGLQAPQPG